MRPSDNRTSRVRAVKQLLLRVLLSLQAPPRNNRAMCCRELPCCGHLAAAGCLDGRDANKNNCSLCSRANIVALRSGGTHSNNISNTNNIITVITTHSCCQTSSFTMSASNKPSCAKSDIFGGEVGASACTRLDAVQRHVVPYLLQRSKAAVKNHSRLKSTIVSIAR